MKTVFEKKMSHVPKVDGTFVGTEVGDNLGGSSFRKAFFSMDVVNGATEPSLASLLQQKIGGPIAFLKRNPHDLAKELHVPYQAVLQIRQEICTSILSQPTGSQPQMNHLHNEDSIQRSFKWNQFCRLSESSAHNSNLYSRDPFVSRCSYNANVPTSQQYHTWTTAAKELMWSHRPTGCTQLNSLFTSSSTSRKSLLVSPFQDGRNNPYMVGYPDEGGMIRNAHKTRYGLPPGCTVELTGAGGAGKSRICYSTIAACALQGMRVLIIDVCGSINLQALHDAILHSVQTQIMQAEALFSQTQTQTQSQTSYTKTGGIAYTQLDEQEQQELVLGAMLLVQITRVYSLRELLDAICSVVDSGSQTPCTTGAGAGAFERASASTSEAKDAADVNEVPVYHLVVVDGMSRALAAALPTDAPSSITTVPGRNSGPLSSAALHSTGIANTTDRTTIIAKENTSKLITSICLAYRACAALGSTVLVALNLDSSIGPANIETHARGNGNAGGNGNGSIATASVSNSNRLLSLHQGVVGVHLHTHAGTGVHHSTSNLNISSSVFDSGTGSGTGNGTAAAAGTAPVSHAHPDMFRSGCMSSMSSIFDISLSVQNLTSTSTNQQYEVKMITRGISHRYTSTILVSAEGKETVRQTVNPVKAVFTDSMLCYGTS